MDRNEKMDEFLSGLLSCAIKSHEATKESEYQYQLQEQMEELLAGELNSNQQRVVEDIIGELEQAYNRETEVVYRQGLKDCVWLLKIIGVLA